VSSRPVFPAVLARLSGALVLLAALGLGFAQQAAAQASAPKHKVVFQVSDADPGKWNLALNNARNVQESLGEGDVAIEIVVYGPGIGMLKKDSSVGKRIDAALGQGVKIVACENTMKGQKLTYDDMHPKIGYVPGGVVELMALQREGYAYIRP
jgi:intracellular sulfur oxidation DsrE/DsrF family protein